MCDSHTVPSLSLAAESCLLPAATSTHCGLYDPIEQGPGMARFCFFFTRVVLFCRDLAVEEPQVFSHSLWHPSGFSVRTIQPVPSLVPDVLGPLESGVERSASPQMA